MNDIILITGGGRSGKSDYGLTLADPFAKKAFVATAEAFDDEMRARVEKHKANRDESYLTIEEPVEIVAKMKSILSAVDVILLDCLTVWVGNLMHYCQTEDCISEKISEFVDFLEDIPCPIVLVTNEVGMGIIPENAMARQFRDTAGRLNQRIAAVANQVTLLVSGIPLALKKPVEKMIGKY